MKTWPDPWRWSNVISRSVDDGKWRADYRIINDTSRPVVHKGDGTVWTARPLGGHDAKNWWRKMSQEKMQISCPICPTFHSSVCQLTVDGRRTTVDEISVEICYKEYDSWFSVLNAMGFYCGLRLEVLEWNTRLNRLLKVNLIHGILTYTKNSSVRNDRTVYLYVGKPKC
jgi:hypothetical protein